MPLSARAAILLQLDLGEHDLGVRQRLQYSLSAKGSERVNTNLTESL